MDLERKPEKPKAEEREKETEMQEMTADSLEETLMLGKIEGQRRRGRQRVRWLDSITDSMEMNFVWQTPTGRVSNRETWHAAVHGVAESDVTEHLISSNKFVKN